MVFALRLAVGLLLLAGIFTMKAELGETLRRIAGASPGWLAAAFAVLVAGQLTSVWKWGWMLRVAGRGASAAMLVRASLVGLFYNNFLPGSVGGDVVKLLMVAPEVGGRARAAASVFMQRNTGVAGLLVIGLPLSLLHPVRVALFPAWLGALNHMATWFALATVGYVVVNAAMLSRRAYRKLWAFLGGRGGGSALLHKLGAGARSLHESLLLFRSSLAGAVAISVLTQFLDCVIVWFIAHAMGLELSIWFCCVCVPMVTLAQLLPVTVNGLGLRESLYLVLLGSVGVPAEAATGLSLISFGLGFVLSLIGGLVHAAGPARRRAGSGPAAR